MVEPYYQDEWVTIYLGDCREILPQLPKVDLVLTDPPYGIDYVTSWRSHWDKLVRPIVGDRDASYEDVWAMCSHLIKEDRHCYIFADFDTSDFTKQQLYPLYPALRIKNGLVWDKGNCSVGDLEGDYGDQWELIIFATKGRRLLNGNRDRNILHYNRVSPSNLLHPTQKPENLISYLITKSTALNEVILDPFLGSGTTCYCAKKLNRKSIGIEIEEKYCEIAANRCQQSVMELNI